MRSAYDLRPDTALDWMSRAGCLGHNPDWWSVPHPRNETAKQICHGCPVKRQCGERGAQLGSQGTIVAGKTHHVLKQEKTVYRRRCVYCDRRFETTAPKQRACTRRCNDSATKARRREGGR